VGGAAPVRFAVAMVDEDGAADRVALHELVARHGHLVDDGDLAGLGAVFTEDVVYDVSALGGGQLLGLREVEDAARALGDRNPVAHHVTNVFVLDLGPDTARVVSKGLGVTVDGGVGSVTYDDDAVRIENGWRIRRRVVRPRRTPLRP
jgi:hypothetical protein